MHNNNVEFYEGHDKLKGLGLEKVSDIQPHKLINLNMDTPLNNFYGLKPFLRK